MCFLGLATLPRTQVVWLAGDAAETKEVAVCSPSKEALGIPCY